MAIGGSFGGGESTLSALMLLADPTLLASRIKELAEAESRASEAIKLAGPASEIIDLREQARVDRVAAANELKKASVEAESIIREADTIKARSSAAYLEVKRNAEAEAKAIIEQASQKMAEANAKYEEEVQRAAELQKRYLELAAREQANADRAAELDKLANDLEDRRKQYEQAADALRKLTEV